MVSNRPLSPIERARIAADYGLDPGMVTTLVRVCPPAHASAGVNQPITSREALANSYRNRARKMRLAKAEKRMGPVMPTWGEE